MAEVTVSTDGLSVTIKVKHAGRIINLRLTADDADLIGTRLFSTARITRLCSCKVGED